MIDIVSLRAQMLSGLAASGYFGNVVGHEPKAAPAREGVTAAIWNANLSVASSGLQSMSALLTFQVRIYNSMLMEPQDDIDPAVMNAADGFLAYIAGHFTLTGEARYIDFQGADSEGLRAESGYLTHDRTPFRVIDIFVPIVINDAYVYQA